MAGYWAFIAFIATLLLVIAIGATALHKNRAEAARLCRDVGGTYIYADGRNICLQPGTVLFVS